uniref:KN motif and ankyrin repeat domains 4 n=1 Tax=Scophthalmus maximus TaxID=52904 RepID=A0A8D3BG63_SCOMX
MGARAVEEKTVGSQSRPNLLRASSMPVTLQQRKGSDSSSPDRIVGTPENGSTENMFRPSPDITERRAVPQERTGLHQQITVALKRVRELEEQVKTIPELKAQICSLREEREKLLLQLQLQRQAQAQAQISTSPSTIAPSSDTGSHAQPCAHRPAEGLSLALTTRTTGVTEKSRVLQAESSPAHGQTGECSAQESERLTQPSEKSDKQKETIERPLEHAVQKLSRDMAGQELTSLRVAIKDTGTGSTQDGNAEKAREPEEETDSLQMVQEKLMILEDKLTRASQELENTNSLLKEQIEENKVKEDKIIQLSEGMRVEMCSPEADSRPRRESIDTGTVTEKVDFANQETETESVNKVDKGTDTDKICVEICVPKASVVGIDLVADATVETHDQVTETEAEVSAVSPPRPRANSMERGTVTERIATQDQTTETPVAERVNQVTETEGEAVTDQPQRPRASSADRGTETERVGTVDRVTETEAAQRADRQTETEMARRQDNNPGRGAEAESQVGGGASSERVVGVDAVVSERLDDGEAEERLRRDCESAVMKVVTDSLVIVLESAPEQTAASDAVSNNEERTGSPAATGDDKEPTIETSGAQKDSETKESTDPEIVVTEIAETKPITAESGEKKDTAEGEIVRVAVKETAVDDVVVTAAEDAAVKTAAPVRPQRGRKPSAEQAQPPPLQLQAAPVRPRRGSSEIQDKQPRAQAQDAPQPEAQTPTQLTEQVRHEAPSGSLVEDKTQAKKPPGESVEEKPPSQPQGPSPGSGGAQTRPKSILAKAHSQTSATRRGAKELKAQQRGATVSQPPSRGSGEAQPRPTRQGSGDSQSSSQGSRRSSGETPPPHKDAGETPSLRRGSGETAQRRGSTEAQASRRDGGEAQPSGRGSSESPTSPAALGQVVTRLTGLLGEQWAQLGSSSGAQQAAGQQESPGAQKHTAGKRAEAGKGATAKPAGKALPAAAAAATGKPGPSKMSSIQSQLVSSLSVLSAFYSPAQKAAAAASKQQEQGLKSIMKKNGVADKQGNKGAKKNLKFVGVNGGYETTSSEESSGDEKSKVEPEEEDSSEPEVEKEKEKEKEPQAAAAAAEEKPEEAAEIQGKDAEVAAEGGAAVAGEKEVQRGLLDPESSQELQEEQAEREKVDKAFIDACLYVKDRMEEVSSPDKEMRQVLVVLYQEWFKVSSQKDSQADTVRLYLRQVGLTTPTLLPYVVNLTDGNGNMALHYSVSHSNFPVVKLLLDTGLCETDNVNKAGYTPVMLAALTAAESPDDLEVAQQLLRHGDVNACSRQAGQTALMLAVSHGRVAMVKLLLGSGADANAQDREGSTALMCASEHGHTHIARLLLETGRCDTGLVDKNGQTARSVAEGTSHQEIVDLLKAHAETRASEPSSSSDLL